MKAIIIQFTFGLVAFDEKCDFKEIILFKKDPKVAARILKEQEDGILSSEIKSLVNQLMVKDFDNFSFENIEIARAIEKSACASQKARHARSAGVTAKDNDRCELRGN